MNIKKLLKFSVLSLFLALLAPTFAQAQQYTLVQTSTSAAITASQTQIRVASATGIYGYAPNLNQTPSNSATPQSAIYIDREEIEVLSVNGTTLQRSSWNQRNGRRSPCLGSNGAGRPRDRFLYERSRRHSGIERRRRRFVHFGEHACYAVAQRQKRLSVALFVGNGNLGTGME